MRKGFIFDMDGVIIDTEPIYLDNVGRILAEQGVNATKAELLSYVGISSHEMWQTLKQNHKLTPTVTWLVDAEQERVLQTFKDANRLTPMPGIPDLLTFLKQSQFKIGLASSSSRMIIDLILQKLHLADFFEAIVGGSEVTNGKPHPEIFLTCAARLDVKPDRCLVLEDSSAGIAGANSAGMTTIGFVNPNSGQQDLAHANYVATSIDDGLLNYIKRVI